MPDQYTNRYYFRRQTVPFRNNACTGLNTLLPDDRIPDTEAVELVNLELNLGGELTKRPPSRLASVLPVPNTVNVFLGIFNISNINYFLVCTNTDLYKSTDGVTWNSIGSLVGGGQVAHAIQYANVVYIVTGTNGVFSWDGTTLTAIAGSPNGSFITTFKDRLWVLNSSYAVLGSLSSRLYFSDVTNPSSWTSTNFIDVNPGDNGLLVALKAVNDKLLVFKNNSTWSLYIQGSPLNWVLRLTKEDIGCIARNSIVEIEGLIYFWSFKGVYKTDGTNFTLISDPIRKLLFTAATPLVYDQGYAARLGDRYILSVPHYSTSSGLFVYNFKVGGWSTWELVNAMTPLFIHKVEINYVNKVYYIDSSSFPGTSRLMFFNDLTPFDDSILIAEPLKDEFTTDYPVKFKTKVFEYFIPASFKRAKAFNLFIDAELPTPSDTIDITYITEDHTETINVSDIDSGRYNYKVKAPGYFRQIQYVFESLNAKKFKFFSYEVKLALKSEDADQGAAL